MVQGCGIWAWCSNSQVVHAVSSSPTGAFTRKDVAFQTWSHEPTVSRAPTGEFVMMFTSAPWGPNGQPPVNATHYQPCNCSSLASTEKCGWSDLVSTLCNKSRLPSEAFRQMMSLTGIYAYFDARAFICMGAKGADYPEQVDGTAGVTPPPIGYLSRGMPTFMSYASQPEGPWSEPMSIPIRGLGDANFAFTIKADGSLWGMGREAMYRAAHWKDNRSYVYFANTTGVIGEDP